MTKRSFLGRVFLSIILLFLVSLIISLFMTRNVKTITKKTTELEALLSEMAWVSPSLSDDRVLYKISFRTCPACFSYYKDEFPKLQKRGVDTRLFTFARAKTPEKNPNEWAILARLYTDKNWALSEQWWDKKSPNQFYSKMDFMPSVIGDSKLTALVKNGRLQMKTLGYLLAENDITMASPTLLWQDRNGVWKAAMGNGPITNSKIRKELGRK